MYMRVTRSRMDPAKVDAASGLVQEIVAAISRRPGFQSITVGGDRATGESISVSVWDTEEHARWNPDSTGDMPSRLQAAGIQIDLPQFFEVVTQR